jgi:hypothetical protein
MGAGSLQLRGTVIASLKAEFPLITMRTACPWSSGRRETVEGLLIVFPLVGFRVLSLVCKPVLYEVIHYTSLYAAVA